MIFTRATERRLVFKVSWKRKMRRSFRTGCCAWTYVLNVPLHKHDLSDRSLSIDVGVASVSICLVSARNYSSEVYVGGSIGEHWPC